MRKDTMRWYLLILILVASTAAADVIVRDDADQTVVRYDRSYALLVGVSDYTAGWRDLTSIPDELASVEAVLVEHGFEVTKVLDPTEDVLRDAFEAFIDAHGRVADHRLLVYFAGHGYSRDLATGTRGYIVPTDAPRPTSDLRGFLAKAVPMTHVATWARDIEARHALFVFDSCFSGTVFDSRSELPIPAAIEAKMGRRVRQFLTAGSADEEVPGRSRFTPAFVEALRGAGDLVQDGYVTGTELGVYLDQKVRTPGHTPQFGRLAGYAEGDFVFRLPVMERSFEQRRDEAIASLQAAVGPTITAAMADRVTLLLAAASEADAEPWLQRIEALDGSSGPEESLAFFYSQHVSSGPSQSPPPSDTSPTRGPPAGDLWTEPKTGMRFRYIPAGTFQMGSPESEEGRHDSETRHTVTLARGYWMGETEVTREQWLTLMAVDPSSFKACGVDCPVSRVNWFEAVAFANALSEENGRAACYRPTGGNGKVAGDDLEYDAVELIPECRGFRLPTEAEWERAARAGTSTALVTGELTILGRMNSPELDPIAWYGGNSGVQYADGAACAGDSWWWRERQDPDSTRCGTQPVGKKLANRWGLYDMLGNVSEWCHDRYGAYRLGVSTDPDGAPSESVGVRVLRGGSWHSLARSVRAASRDSDAAGRRHWDVGFRLVFSAVEP